MCPSFHSSFPRRMCRLHIFNQYLLSLGCLPFSFPHEMHPFLPVLSLQLSTCTDVLGSHLMVSCSHRSHRRSLTLVPGTPSSNALKAMHPRGPWPRCSGAWDWLRPLSASHFASWALRQHDAQWTHTSAPALQPLCAKGSHRVLGGVQRPG